MMENKMNILFLTLMKINDFSQTGIYPDLINEFAKNGYDIYVVAPCEHKDKDDYELIKEKGHVHLINALIPDYFGVGLIQKGISSLLIERRYLKAIKSAIPNIKFDMILYSTPPITFSGVIEKIKKRDNSYTYLLLKDIWPQGPIDIGALSTKGIKGVVTKYFQKKEKRLYMVSDYIGCMSEKNCQYLIKQSQINKDIIEVCPNAIKVNDKIIVNREKIRNEYKLPLSKSIFVYGGNLGVAQGIDFIISCLVENEKKDNTFILIIGSGTEYKKLECWFNNNKPLNSKLISSLPKEKYMDVMASCDVGLIFLDHRFTIPNFPSRLLSYMNAGIPVLAATDPNSDIGEVITEGEFGYWCESNNVNLFIELMEKMTSKDDCEIKGKKAFEYLKENYCIEKAYDTIVSHLQ